MTIKQIIKALCSGDLVAFELEELEEKMKRNG